MITKYFIIINTGVTSIKIEIPYDPSWSIYEVVNTMGNLTSVDNHEVREKVTIEGNSQTTVNYHLFKMP